MRKRLFVIIFLVIILFNIEPKKKDDTKGKDSNSNTDTHIKNKQNERIEKKHENNLENIENHYRNNNQNQMYLIINLTNESEDQIEFLSKKLKKENLNIDDILNLKQNILKFLDNSELIFKNLGKTEKNNISEQIDIIHNTKKSLIKNIMEIEKKVESNNYKNKNLANKMNNVKKAVNKLNRQYRAINWILFEQ